MCHVYAQNWKHSRQKTDHCSGGGGLSIHLPGYVGYLGIPSGFENGGFSN